MPRGARFEVQLFSSLQSSRIGQGTVWSFSHLYSLNSMLMPERYSADPEVLAGLSHDQLWQALASVAQIVARDCECFEAEAVCAKDGITDTKRSGFLPADADHRELFINQVLEWLRDCVECTEAFLMLATQCQKDGESQVKLRFHEEPERWSLLLTGSEFKEVQQVLRASSLPESLFLPQQEPQFLPHRFTLVNA